MTYTFDEEVAKEYGVNEAIMIANFQFWIKKNKANDENYFDGHYWTYNSNKALQELFPFWSAKTIRTTLGHLKDQNILITGNYNKQTYDRTLWYAFVDEDKWLGLNRQMDLPKTANGLAENGKPIPDNIPDINKENNINKFILKESSKKRFVKPTLEQVQAYCQERNNGVEPEKFINYYESKGWVVGKSPMKDWKAAVRTWEKSGYNQPKTEQPTQSGALPPPTLEEWLEFSDSLELDDDVMKKAYQYYQDADWYDRNGKKIFNWKQKIRAIWDKDENKIIKPRVFVID